MSSSWKEQKNHSTIEDCSKLIYIICSSRKISTETCVEVCIAAAVDNYFAQGTEIKAGVSISSNRYHFLRLSLSIHHSTLFHSEFYTATNRDVDVLYSLFEPCSPIQPSSSSSSSSSRASLRVSPGFIIYLLQSVRDGPRPKMSVASLRSSMWERRSPTMDGSSFVVWPQKRIRTN